MRMAIFSDIHGNIYAFEKVLKSIKKQKVDIFIFCGDICGYYYYQDEIIGMLSDLENLYAVLGNHDKLFLDILKGRESMERYTNKYGKSMQLLKENISNDSLNFLKNLPEKQEISIGNDKIGIFHGSPFDYLEGYVYPDTPIEEYEILPYKYIFLGHTHYKMHREVNNKIIINPGSSGQPRDENVPSYALVDLYKDTVEFIGVKYDTTLLVNEIINYNETNKYLIDILYRRGK